MTLFFHPCSIYASQPVVPIRRRRSTVIDRHFTVLLRGHRLSPLKESYIALLRAAWIMRFSARSTPGLFPSRQENPRRNTPPDTRDGGFFLEVPFPKSLKIGDGFRECLWKGSLVITLGKLFSAGYF